MQTSPPAKKLALRSSHRSLRLGISHAAPAGTWQAPRKDPPPAPPRGGRR